MLKIENALNKILSEWNPLGVDDHVASEEYNCYIPLIIKAKGNKEELMRCLEDILVNKLATGYDSNNRVHLKDLQNVCDRIMSIEP